MQRFLELVVSGKIFTWYVTVLNITGAKVVGLNSELASNFESTMRVFYQTQMLNAYINGTRLCFDSMVFEENRKDSASYVNLVKDFEKLATYMP